MVILFAFTFGMVFGVVFEKRIRKYKDAAVRAAKAAQAEIEKT